MAYFMDKTHLSWIFAYQKKCCDNLLQRCHRARLQLCRERQGFNFTHIGLLLIPYFNRQNNDDLILAIQSAGVERGRNGFRKNKSMEKQPESEEDLLEHRTEGTDAFDTLYIGCEKFPQHDLYPICVGGVR